MVGLAPYNLQAGASVTTLASVGPLANSNTLTGWLSLLDAVTDATDNPLYPKYGAKGNAIKLVDGTISGGALNTLTSASASFTAADVGKTIAVQSAGTSNGLTAFSSVALGNNALKTTIASIVSSTSVTLTLSATVAVTGVVVVYGTDDTAAIQKALDSAATRKSCVVDLGGRSYLISDALSMMYGKQEIRNGTLLQVDTGSTTYGGVGSTFNYSQASTIGLNNGVYSAAYTGPAYPSGRAAFTNSYYTGTNSDWSYGYSVHDLTIDCSAVSTGYPGQVSARQIGDGVIAGYYIGNVRIYNNNIINAQTSGISVHAAFDATIYNNTINGFRCSLDGSGNVWGGNAIQSFTAYPGVVDAYTVETGANKILNNTVIGSPANTPFPGPFVSSAQNGLLSCNIGIDIQTGGRPNGTPQFWAANTTYNLNDRVMNGSYVYVCTVGGISASSGGPTGTGSAAITDNTVTWMLALSGLQWVPSSPSSLKTYALGARVNNLGNTYICVQAGSPALSSNSGGALPTGPTGTGTSIADGAFATAGVWTTGTAYTVGQTVSVGTAIYTCSIGGTAGATPPSGTSTTVAVSDGGASWLYVSPQGCLWNYTFGGPNWTQNTSYNVGQKIYNGPYWWVCTTAGISAASGTGPSGDGAYTLDGTVIWQAQKSYARPIPQEMISGNHIRRCNFGIMVEGQRSGGSGEVIVTNNDVLNCLTGIYFYADQQDFGAVAPWDNGYAVVIANNRVSGSYFFGVNVAGEAFLIADNLIQDWGVTSTNFNALGCLVSQGTLAKAISISPSSALTGTIIYGGVVHDNLCIMHNSFDPITNFFSHAGISVQTNFDNQVWRGVSVKGNVVDFGPSIKSIAAVWVASTSYTLGQYVSKSGSTYRCTVSGTSGATGPSGTSLTTPVTDSGVTWIYVGVAYTYLPSSNAGILMSGMLEDITIHDNNLTRCPSAAIVAQSRRSLATWNMSPARVSIKNNNIVDCNAAMTSASSAINISADGRHGFVIEDNVINDTGINRLSYAMSIAVQEVAGTDAVVNDIRIRGNRVKGGTLDAYTFRVMSAGSNIKIENNDSFNYSAALPVVNSFSGYMYAGTLFYSTVATQGATLGWVVSIGGRVTTTNWAINTAYTLNNYVNNGGNVYKCVVAGTSASSGGPTGTSTSTPVVDNAASWLYVSPVPIISPVGIIENTPALTVAAAGTNTGTATVLAKGASNVTTVASGSGVRVPTLVANDTLYIINNGANALLVYPTTGGSLNGLAVNAAISVAVGATLIVKAFSSTLALANG